MLLLKNYQVLRVQCFVIIVNMKINRCRVKCASKTLLNCFTSVFCCIVWGKCGIG